jgi:methylmalonyl-CoA mutase cobalamin-binding subunit
LQEAGVTAVLTPGSTVEEITAKIADILQAQNA